MAIKSFADQTTSDVFHGLNTKDARRVPQEIWKVAQRKLDLLHRATSTQDLTQPGLHMKPLKYDRPGFYSIRINLVYRIHFRFENGDAHEVEINADHGQHTS
jgi:proteic killer suppression protein